MQEIVMKLLEENEKIKSLKDLPVATLKIIKMYLDNGLADVVDQKEDEIKNNTFTYRAVRTCVAQNYNYLIKILDCKYRVDLDDARAVNKKEIGKKLRLCRGCPLKECIKGTVAEFLFEMQKVNKGLEKPVNPVEIVNELLKASEQDKNYEKEADRTLFSNVAAYTLLYVQAILENSFVEMEEFNQDTRIAKFKYVDLIKRENFNFYINKLYEYYDNKSYKELEINVDNFDLLPDENLADYEYFYKLAAFYLYKMNVENVNVIDGLSKYLQERDKDIIRNRSKFLLVYMTTKLKNYHAIKKLKAR